MRKLLVVLILVFAISSPVGCIQGGTRELVSEEEAREIVYDYVVNMYQYREYNGTNLVPGLALKLGCEDCYGFVYTFDVQPSDKLPGVVTGFKVDIEVESGTVNKTWITEIRRNVTSNILEIGEVCGGSTNGSCTIGSDCIKGGCSGQVCQSRLEEPIITTCEWIDCYSASTYGLECMCADGQCRWIKQGS